MLFVEKISVFLQIGVRQNGWFVMENPTKMEDLAVHLFLETPICFFYPPNTRKKTWNILSIPSTSLSVILDDPNYRR